MRVCEHGRNRVGLGLAVGVLLALGVVPLSGCVMVVGGLGASWHYERNTAAFEAENADREKQGLPPLTREEWNAAREAKAARGSPPEPE